MQTLSFIMAVVVFGFPGFAYLYSSIQSLSVTHTLPVNLHFEANDFWEPDATV